MFRKIQQSFLQITFFLCSFSTFAQYSNTSPAEAKEISKRILLVGLEEADSSVFDQLDNEKDAIARYMATVEGKNEALKRAIFKHWKYSSEVVFKPSSEARKMAKKEKLKYAFMHYGEEIESAILANGYMGSGKKNFGYYYQNATLRYNYAMRKSIESYNIFTIEIDIATSNIIKVYLSKSYPSTADVSLALNKIQYTLNFLSSGFGSYHDLLTKKVTANNLELKNKTLLIDANDFVTNISMDEIKSVYPYSVKIVSYIEIEQLIEKADTNFAVLDFARFDDAKRVLNVSNIGNGTLYKTLTNQAYDVPNEAMTFGYFSYPGIKLSDIASIVD